MREVRNNGTREVPAMLGRVCPHIYGHMRGQQLRRQRRVQRRDAVLRRGRLRRAAGGLCVVQTWRRHVKTGALHGMCARLLPQRNDRRSNDVRGATELRRGRSEQEHSQRMRC